MYDEWWDLEREGKKQILIFKKKKSHKGKLQSYKNKEFHTLPRINILIANN